MRLIKPKIGTFNPRATVLTGGSTRAFDIRMPRGGSLVHAHFAVLSGGPVHVDCYLIDPAGGSRYNAQVFSGPAYSVSGFAGMGELTRACAFPMPEDQDVYLRCDVVNYTGADVVVGLSGITIGEKVWAPNAGYQPRNELFVWEGEFSVAQVVAVPSPIGIIITPGENNYVELLSWRLGPDNYGANRTVTFILRIGSSYFRYYESASVDNQALYGPTQSVYDADTASTVAVIGSSNQNPRASGDNESFIFNGASLANTETMTLKVIALVRAIPTASANGSGITLTTTTNKIKGVVRL